MINFFYRFVLKTAAIMQPLFANTMGKAKIVEWFKDMFTAFSAAKQALAAATLLVRPHATAPTSITLDASNIAVGGVLGQLLQDQWRPLAFLVGNYTLWKLGLVPLIRNC